MALACEPGVLTPSGCRDVVLSESYWSGPHHMKFCLDAKWHLRTASVTKTRARVIKSDCRSASPRRLAAMRTSSPQMVSRGSYSNYSLLMQDEDFTPQGLANIGWAFATLALCEPHVRAGCLLAAACFNGQCHCASSDFLVGACQQKQLYLALAVSLLPSAPSLVA